MRDDNVGRQVIDAIIDEDRVAELQGVRFEDGADTGFGREWRKPVVAVISGGKRYDTLVERIEAGYGRFDADSARDLMTRPVCMDSNLHSVLFAPDTLDFWVANADSQNPAAHTRYTRYNLQELLEDPRVQ